MEGLLVEAVVAYQGVVQCKLKESKVALPSISLLLATLCFLVLIIQKPTHWGLLRLAADIFQCNPQTNSLYMCWIGSSSGCDGC